VSCSSVIRVALARWAGLETYNLLNRTNFGNPTGARNSVNFLKAIVAGTGRTAQLGVRVTF